MSAASHRPTATTHLIAAWRPALRGHSAWPRVFTLAVLIVLSLTEPSQAYIGPGAGFAVGSTLFAFFMALLSGLAAILLWPMRWLIRSIRGRRAHAKARVKRVVILGLDGMEPTLVERYMGEGKLPNLKRLASQGGFRRLGTTAPPLSPVAWSTFLTGCNPGKHNIFDFLTRDRRNYMPLLSSVSIRPPSRSIKIGKWRFPLGKPSIRLHRKGKPFWNVLSEHGVFGSVIRVPITFPPERFGGVLLSAMCVPDLRGTQGTFSFYTTRELGDEHIGGECIRVSREGDVVRSYLVGPPDDSGNGQGGEGQGFLRCPFELRIKSADKAVLKVGGETIALVRGQYTPWVNVLFKAPMGVKVRGICEFLWQSSEPEFELYVTPIQIDPEKPAMPISHPVVFSKYLSKNQGLYATLGLAEDTWALNAKILGDDGFLHQCIEADTEREAMFFDALDKVDRGLCVCVFDGTDRIQHMFWRYIDPNHPALNGQSDSPHRNTIEEHYIRMDELVGRTMQRCDDSQTVLMVISDHGFHPFRRGVDLNVWLEQNGYLKLAPNGRGRKYLAGVDWKNTRAYCLGLAGIWLNIRGREAQGIVPPEEAGELRRELCEALSGLRDEESGNGKSGEGEPGKVAVNRAYDAHRIYHGPYRAEGPDIIVGYNTGYRVSWEAAIGQPTEKLFHDNTKAWSGDHCIDPKLVPGVLFCNRKIGADHPHLMDLGPTVLDLFGVRVPPHMDGRPVALSDPDGRFPGAASSGAGGNSAGNTPGAGSLNDSSIPPRETTCQA